jgi:hypothetical protein
MIVWVHWTLAAFAMDLVIFMNAVALTFLREIAIAMAVSPQPGTTVTASASRTPMVTAYATPTKPLDVRTAKRATTTHRQPMTTAHAQPLMNAVCVEATESPKANAIATETSLTLAAFAAAMASLRARVIATVRFQLPDTIATALA